jgi:hypothetical protein
MMRGTRQQNRTSPNMERMYFVWQKPAIVYQASKLEIRESELENKDNWHCKRWVPLSLDIVNIN